MTKYIFALTALGIVMSGCSSNSGYGTSSNPVAPSDTAAVSFVSSVQPIFTANCTNSSCHGGTNPQQGQNLTAGQAYSNIVNVTSHEVPAYLRIKPFSSDSSYLYMKITGDPRIAGGTVKMPKGGSLSPAQIQIIKSWIDQGAKNN
jgi:hypothetical protein